jgi:hypothetical protein
VLSSGQPVTLFKEKVPAALVPQAGSATKSIVDSSAAATK